MKAHPVGEEAVDAAFDAGVKPARPRQEREDHRRTVRLMLEAANDPLRREHWREFSERLDDVLTSLEDDGRTQQRLRSLTHEAAGRAQVEAAQTVRAAISKVSEGLEQ